MIPTAISLGGAVILLLDIFAIVSVLRQSSGATHKVGKARPLKRRTGRDVP